MYLEKLGDTEHKRTATLLPPPLRVHTLRALLGQARDWHEGGEEINQHSFRCLATISSKQTHPVSETDIKIINN